MTDSPAGATLANWRTPPYNRMSFNRVRELIPSANIAAGPAASELPRRHRDLARLSFAAPGGEPTSLARFLADTYTDAFMVLRRGRVAFEWYRTPEAAGEPHIVFSVSKSLTAILAGVLAGLGRLDPDAPVTRYVPEAAGSVYAETSVRHVLDMTVSLAFEEAYLTPDELFLRYRESTGWNPRRPGSEEHLHGFLAKLAKAGHPHGERFHYRSPNSDMLGWIVERAGGARYGTLMSELIWKRMGAAGNAYITVDGLGAARAAGGVCTRLDDLARFGEMIRRRGVAQGQQVVPGEWIDDIRSGGSVEAWRLGDMLSFLPECRYRSKWYNRVDREVAMAVGIHGQWLVVDAEADLVIAKQSSQPQPVEDGIDQLHFAAFDALAEALG